MGQPTKNITYVVVSALNRIGLDMDKYDWLEQIAFEWYSELAGVNDIPSVKVAHFGVGNSSRIWSMPSDFIRIGKVGYELGGNFMTLTRNDTMITPVEACDTMDQVDTASGGYWFPDHFWGGVYYGPIFTRGGGFNRAYYHVNDTDRQIEFSLDVAHLPNGKALIEYLSSGEPCGTTLVRPAFIEPFRNYLIWQCHEHAEVTGTNYGKAKDRERIYHETMYNHKGTAFALNVSEVLDAVWESTRFSIR